MQKVIGSIIALIALVFISAASYSTTYYVNPGDTIQDAIDSATNGDTVIITPGIYTGDGNRDIDFNGKAITVRSTDPDDTAVVEATIIDCEGSDTEPHRGFYFHSGENNACVVAGLTITNGDTENGGGIYCDNSSPTLINCIFKGATQQTGAAVHTVPTAAVQH